MEFLVINVTHGLWEGEIGIGLGFLKCECREKQIIKWISRISNKEVLSTVITKQITFEYRRGKKLDGMHERQRNNNYYP